MNANITFNDEKNGIEIRFDEKPEQKVIDSMKENGFRWSNKQKMWFTKRNNERVQFANSLGEVECNSFGSKNKIEKRCYNLWDLTRTEDIPNNYKLYRIHDPKEIATIVRKHIKSRFPMCKFSVRSDYNSISVDLLSSPFEKDGDELKAIIHYVYLFVESYNYDNSDSMTDYFDVNFYFSGERNIVSYQYEQSGITDDIEAIMATFRANRSAWEKEKAIREEKEFQERMKQIEVERQIAAEAAKKEASDKNEIENGSVITDRVCPYYILNALSPRFNKLCSIDEAEIDRGEYNIQTCQITREVHMSKELYDKFKNMLLCDFSFLSGKGGTATLDNRINDMIDYTKMSEEERKTVKFYDYDCIAIFCENQLMFVCNPEGYDYARYILIPGEDSIFTNEYVIDQVLSNEVLAKNREVFDELYDKSADIIINNHLNKDWNGLKFNEYRKYMTEYILESGITFNADIVRSIPSDAVEFKIAMYRLLEETESIGEQFSNSKLAEGQKVTVFQISDFGAMSISRSTFSSFSIKDYAQYKNAVKFVFKPERKRNLYYRYLYRDVLIYNGWLELPENILFEITDKENGVVCKKSRYLSCDKKQYDAIIEYFKDQGISPIINTYKPIF